MPNLFSPAEVWKPHTPEVLYSHIGLALMFVAVLDGCRTESHPPLLASKFQGTLSALDGPVPENRRPRSRVPFGRTSASAASRMPLLFRSSPRVLLTTVLQVPVPAPVQQANGLPAPTHWALDPTGANSDEKVTSSSGRMNRSTGSMTSGRSMSWLRFRSRTPRQVSPGPARQSVE